MNKLVLSLFQGIGMLDRGFTKQGFTVVCGPEKINGACITEFTGIKGVFGGVIGGSPCVDYSGLNRNPSDYSDRMKEQFETIVEECQPDWFLLENVLRVPDIHLEGYYVQRFHLSPRDLGYQQSRPRCFQFGSKKGLILELPEPVKNNLPFVSCVTASQGKDKSVGGSLTFANFKALTHRPNSKVLLCRQNIGLLAMEYIWAFLLSLLRA